VVNTMSSSTFSSTASLSLSIDLAAVASSDDKEEYKSMSPLPIIKDKVERFGDDQPKSSLVVFSSSLRVVLVPNKQEYKEAKCDLWWTGEDFSAFHESARSEVKTCSMNRSVSHKEAKAILYQPGEKGDLYMEEIEDDYMMGGSSRESSIDSERNMSSESDAGPGPNGFSDWLSKQVPILSPSLAPEPLQRVDSMSCMAAKKCKRKHKEKEKDKSVQAPVDDEIARQDSVDDSFGASSSAPLFYEDLHLSVAIPTEVALVNRERMSKKSVVEKED
jgi:hypothetical protein